MKMKTVGDLLTTSANCRNKEKPLRTSLDTIFKSLVFRRNNRFDVIVVKNTKYSDFNEHFRAEIGKKQILANQSTRFN